LKKWSMKVPDARYDAGHESRMSAGRTLETQGIGHGERFKRRDSLNGLKTQRLSSELPLKRVPGRRGPQAEEEIQIREKAGTAANPSGRLGS